MYEGATATRKEDVATSFLLASDLASKVDSKQEDEVEVPACLSLRLTGQKKKQVQVRSMFKSSSLDPRTWNAGKESESEEDYSSPTFSRKGDLCNPVCRRGINNG